MLKGLFAVFLHIDIVIYLWDNLHKIMFMSVIIYKNNCPQEAGIWPCPGHCPHFSQVMMPVRNSAAFSGTRAEPSFWGPFPLDLVCSSPSNIRKIFFCYRSYLSGWLLQISLRSLLEWSAWSRSSCGLKEKRKFNFVCLETSDKM